ncbi:uncharacterized protein LOC135595338 isoform X4 [Musa acuminata AAA Group]|uniref:uncharacterized protein LOC135595338 isoform X4 n=1 Tax=Musa acuminata AAA Group TaxID=214697 RepID=UPI0031DA3001
MGEGLFFFIWLKLIKKKHNSSVSSVEWHPNNILLATAYTDDKCRVFSTFIKDLDSRTRACPCMDPPRRKETRDDGDGTPRFCTHLEEIEQHHVSFNLVHVPCRAELLSIQRTYHIFDCDDSQVTRTTAPSKCLYVPEKPKDL